MLTSTNDFEQNALALEQSEISYWAKLYEQDPAIGQFKKWYDKGALACVYPEVQELAMNRVLGWGWHKDAVPVDLLRFVEFYQMQQCYRFFIQLSPLVPDYQQKKQWLQSHGFRKHNHWAKLWRPIVGYTPAVNSFLRLEVIKEDKALLYGQIIKQSFGWNYPNLEHWLAASVGRTGYQHYLVFLDEKAIAAGALHVEGAYASMAFAGTLANYRGMGAQQLLLYHRTKDAYQEGARYLVSETAEDRPDHPVTSFRNMQRFGFDLAYLRENWLWEGG